MSATPLTPSAVVPLVPTLVAATLLSPLVRLLRVPAADGRVLPGYTPGAHVRVQVSLPGGASDWRAYSLIQLDPTPDAGLAPSDYLIAVRREDSGRGGSLCMHQGLQVGQRVLVEPPKNEFALQDIAGRSMLVAGGIGITPLASMAAQLVATGRPVTLVYAGRSRELMALLPELTALLGGDLQVHADVEAGGPLNIDAVLGRCAAQDHLYVCGPKPLLDGVLARTQARGWALERVHFEVFGAPVAESGDQAFEVVLEQSGRSLTVAADTTILDALLAAGCDPMFDCKRGECGVCAVPVLDGEIDHRDYVLSPFERREGRVIQICISRAKGQRLVLDI